MSILGFLSSQLRTNILKFPPTKNCRAMVAIERLYDILSGYKELARKFEQVESYLGRVC